MQAQPHHLNTTSLDKLIQYPNTKKPKKIKAEQMATHTLKDKKQKHKNTETVTFDYNEPRQTNPIP